MSARRLAANALLMVALGLAVGHLLALGYYQRDQLLAARAESPDEPALRQHVRYQALVERRSLALAGIVVLGSAALLGAGGLAEGLALLLAGYGALGSAMAAEMALLDYERVPWPLVPTAAAGERVGLVLGLCLGLLALAALAIGRAWGAEVPPRRRSRRPRRSTNQRRTPRDMLDRPGRLGRAPSDQRGDYRHTQEDADAGCED